MKNDFKTYFNLAEKFEFHKINNDYNKYKSVNKNKTIAYVLLTATSFIVVKTIRSLYVSRKMFSSNLDYWVTVKKIKLDLLKGRNISTIKNSIKTLDNAVHKVFNLLDHSSHK